MSFEEYKDSINQASPPEKINQLLQALWYDAKGDWQKAHHIAQDIENKEGAWVHGYLHRKEGDPSNAQYWYSSAKRPMPTAPLDAEWEEIVKALLQIKDKF